MASLAAAALAGSTVLGGNPAAAQSPPTTAPLVAAAAGTYTVQRGDTLFSLAKRFGVTVDQLASANGIGDRNRLPAGTVLRVPSRNAAPTTTVRPPSPATTPPPATAAPAPTTAAPTTPAPGTAAPATPAPVASGTTYTVQRGQGLWRIAQTLGVPLADLLALNGMTAGSRIVPGQVLAVPAAPGTPTTAPPTTAAPTTVAPPPATAPATTVPPATAPPATTPPTLAPGTGPTADQVRRLPTALVRTPARLALWPAFVRAAAENNLPFDLLAAMCWQESTWLVGAVSPSGAIGVCQVMPTTGAYVASSLLKTRPLRLDDGPRTSASGPATCGSCSTS